MKDYENVNRENRVHVSKKHKDITGKWFGRLQALRQTDIGEKGRYNWLCLCSCLGTREVGFDNLTLGIITHCGCEDPADQEDEEELPEVSSPLRPPWMSKGQVMLLLLTLPGPLGQGMKIAQAAKRLDISPKAAYMKLQRFRESFNEAADKVDAMKSTMVRERASTDIARGIKTNSLDQLQECYGEDIVTSMVRHIF